MKLKNDKQWRELHNIRKYCMGGYTPEYNPEYLTPTNQNGFDRIVIGSPSIVSWAITPVFTHNINGSYLNVQHVADCEILNKTESLAVPFGNSIFTIYPNPSFGKITYRVVEPLADNAKFTIYSFTGQILSEYMINDQEGDIAFELNAGVYSLVLFNGMSVTQETISIIK